MVQGGPSAFTICGMKMMGAGGSGSGGLVSIGQGGGSRHGGLIPSKQLSVDIREATRFFYTTCACCRAFAT